MKKLIVLLYLLSIVFACSEDHSEKKLIDPSYTPNGKFEIGTLDSTSFSNNYFGFSFSIPGDNWYILNTEAYNEAIENGKRISVSKGTSEKELDITIKNLYNLITFEKPNTDTTKISYQTIAFVAESFDHMKGIKNVSEYFEMTDKYLKANFASALPKCRATNIENKTVNNKIFLVQDIEFTDINNTKYYQKTYSAKFDNYLFNILVLYQNDMQLKENEKLLENITWK